MFFHSNLDSVSSKQMIEQFTNFVFNLKSIVIHLKVVNEFHRHASFYFLVAQEEDFIFSVRMTVKEERKTSETWLPGGLVEVYATSRNNK